MVRQELIDPVQQGAVRGAVRRPEEVNGIKVGVNVDHRLGRQGTHNGGLDFGPAAGPRPAGSAQAVALCRLRILGGDGLCHR